MASQMIDLSNREVTKGPSEKELMRATFFDNETILQFCFDKQSSVLGKLVGYFPYPHMVQMCIVVLEYHPERGKIEKLFIEYDKHNRQGRCFQSPVTIEQIFALRY